MKNINLKTFILLGLMLLFFACVEEQRTDEQLARDKIMAVEDLLRDNQWGFNELTVSVRFESRAIPLLANLADENGMVQPGIYNSYAIFGDNQRQLKYTYEFTRDDILLDTTDLSNFNRIAGYYVLSTSQIRINPDTARRVVFDYVNDIEANRFLMSTSSNYSEEFIAAINNRLIGSLLSGKPTKLANAVVKMLQQNENVKKAIERFLYDLIHGKIEEITQSPEELSEKFARFIIGKLNEINWEEVLYNKILEFLQNLQAEDPEEKASEISKRIAEKIQASLTQADLYEVLLPIMQDFENEKLPVLSSRIAAEVYNKIASELSEENIYNRVYPVWEQFTTADSTTVTETADTLAAIAKARFFNKDSLTLKLQPFVQSIEDTPTRSLSVLAQDIIDSVFVPAVDQINEAFPGLELDPEWNSIKPIITSILTTIKAKLSSSTVEELSADLAESIIGIIEVILQKGFEKAIYNLQQIPADQAASVIASWVTNMVEMAEQPVIDFIESKLDEILQKFEADKAAQVLSKLIHSKIIEVFSEENLYNLFLPLLGAFQETDLEKISRTIASWITELGLLPEDLTEEELITSLSVLIGDLIGNVDPDNITQKLVDLLLNNKLVEKLDGKILKEVLEVKIYELLGRLAGNVNAIDNIALVLQSK